jgi:hypothetical protein
MTATLMSDVWIKILKLEVVALFPGKLDFITEKTGQHYTRESQ